MTKKEEIEAAYKELDQLYNNPQPEVKAKADYWDDYDNAEWDVYEQEVDKIEAEREKILLEKAEKARKAAEIARQKEIEEAKKNPDKIHWTIRKVKPTYWDVSGDDSSLNPNFW